MATVGAYEAKTHLPKLLDRVSKGERITITKHGVAVAVLEPPDTARKVKPRLVIEKLKDFRQQHKLAGISIREMIEEGRR
jgi:prevent-host-death family protein